MMLRLSNIISKLHELNFIKIFAASLFSVTVSKNCHQFGHCNKFKSMPFVKLPGPCCRGRRMISHVIGTDDESLSRYNYLPGQQETLCDVALLQSLEIHTHLDIRCE
jgi:hypothetical protein